MPVRFMVVLLAYRGRAEHLCLQKRKHTQMRHPASLRYTLVRLQNPHGSCLDVLGRAIGAKLAELHMVSYIAGMSTPVFSIDRVLYASRAAMIEVISEHLKNGAIVQIEDSTRPRSMCLCYEIRPGEAAFRLIGAHGRQMGVFASVAALVDHAEAVTRT